MKGGGIRLIMVALIVTGLYAWFGNAIPQSAWEAPKKKILTAQMSPKELAMEGALISKKKGVSGVCYSVVGEKMRGRDV
jgi:hypothetical protein